MLLTPISHVLFLSFFRDEGYSRIMMRIDEILSVRIAINVNINMIEFLMSTSPRLDGHRDKVLEILLHRDDILRKYSEMRILK